jgi:hypothetical protein
VSDNRQQSEPIRPTTFEPIDLDPIAAAELPLDAFVKALLAKLEEQKDKRVGFYEALRRSNARWANGARWVLALLGSIAFLLTGAAAVLRFGWPEWGTDKGVLVVALAIYAVMGAISFYEKGTDKTSSYFRQVDTILAIRDLWTRLQFETLKDLMAFKVIATADRASAEPAARERMRRLAEAFCNDLDKASSGEMTNWRTEFLASLSELEAAAKKGSDDVTGAIQASLKAASEAKEKAETAAAEAKAAAKQAEDAHKPGNVNLTVTGDFEDSVVILIDDREAARSTGRSIGLQGIVPGSHKIAARAKKGTKDLEASIVVEIKPGIHDVTIALA